MEPPQQEEPDTRSISLLKSPPLCRGYARKMVQQKVTLEAFTSIRGIVGENPERSGLRTTRPFSGARHLLRPVAGHNPGEPR